MQSNIIHSRMLIAGILLIAMLACNLSAGSPSASPTAEQQSPLIPVAGPAATATIPATLVPDSSDVVITHLVTPAAPRGGKLVYDVESAGTAPEKRAPYGDSYDINRLERPFSQDMSYISDLDITSFTVAKDNDWWYVSIHLIGANPNNPLGINYGIELDLDRDGYGDYLIWAHPPYTDQWETAPVQIYQDKNHNTGGVSPSKSDAPFDADGYEAPIFDGSTGGADPDLAWIRINAGADATVQFAFKRSWSGSVFMLGVIADAGLKDPGKLDYVDRFSIAEAGSSVKANTNYPLKALIQVDNTCREAFGFEPNHFEPQGCPVEPTPTKEHKPPEVGTPAGCPDPGNCTYGWDPTFCMCIIG